MKTKRKFKPFLIFIPLSILSFIFTAYIFLNYPPDYKFTLANIKIPVLPFFFASLFGFIFSLVTFISRNKLQGTVFASLISFYLFLRYLELTNLLFLGLVLALFITIELFIYKKK